MTMSATTAPNLHIDAANGVTYRYRRFGNPTDSGAPLVFLQHYRGTLDNWDPLLIDTIAAQREVILVDNAGVAGSTGTTPDTVEEMARDALAFLDAVGATRYDLLGFSLGGFIAQEIALRRPWQARRSAAPTATIPPLSPPGTPNSPQSALGASLNSRLPRLAGIHQPVLIANGDHDLMVPTKDSYLLADHLPNAKLSIYPDAGHGFLFQYHISAVRIWVITTWRRPSVLACPRAVAASFWARGRSPSEAIRGAKAASTCVASLPQGEAAPVGRSCHPEVTVQAGASVQQMRAKVADPADRAHLWPPLLAMYPAYDDYQAKTEWQIPVVVTPH